VAHVTGRSVKQWRTTPPQDTALRFARHLPCRNLPAFADLEQASLQDDEPQQPATDDKAAPQAQHATQTKLAAPARLGERKHARSHLPHRWLHAAMRASRHGKRQEHSRSILRALRGKTQAQRRQGGDQNLASHAAAQRGV
jgi:hypothetical protein